MRSPCSKQGDGYFRGELRRGLEVANKIFKVNNFRKTVQYLKKNGVRHAFYAAKERIEEERREDYYYREPSEGTLEAQRKESGEYGEVFSIVVPAFETKEEFLREMIASVQRQSYAKWELIIADASNSDCVKKIVEEIMEQSCDCRINYRRLEENKGISGNTNAGIAFASGDYIALLDHDDFLAPDALYHMVTEVRHAKNTGVIPALIYTDEDKYDNGTRQYLSPHRKTELNFDLILSNNYICHFTAIESALMKRLQLRREYDGAQDYDLILRVISELRKTPVIDNQGNPWQSRILHIPRILYHWRCHADSTAQNTASKGYAYEAGKTALEDFLDKQGWRGAVGHSLHLGFYQIEYVPDLLTVREDVGIVGGRILDAHGRICGGAMEADGGCLYLGLHKEYSGGNTHRAVLKQEAAAVDIRCVQVRPELREAFEQITGLPYTERTIRCKTDRGRKEMRIADVRRLSCDDAGYRKLSLELSKAAQNRKYLVLWDPGITITV